MQNPYSAEERIPPLLLPTPNFQLFNPSTLQLFNFKLRTSNFISSTLQPYTRKTTNEQDYHSHRLRHCVRLRLSDPHPSREKQKARRTLDFIGQDALFKLVEIRGVEPLTFSMPLDVPNRDFTRVFQLLHLQFLFCG